MKKYSKYLLVLCIVLFSCFFGYICYSGINSLFMTNLSGSNYKTVEVTTWNELKNAISDNTCNKIIIKSNLVANSVINIKNKEITIISNNNVTINRDASFTGYFFKITDGSKLYFGDSNYKIIINGIKTLKSDTVFIAEDSNLNLNNISVNNNYSSSDGGAVRVIRSTANISNSSFDSNMGVYGGAICVYSYTPKSTLTISNSNITNNTSNYSGGGIYAYGNLTISNSNISNNTAETYGGGLIVKDYAEITNTVFDSNKAKNNSGGGIRVDGKLKITGGSITNNVAKQNGGGIDYEVGQLVDEKSIYKSVSFSGNSAGFSNDVFPDPKNIIDWKEDSSLNIKNLSDNITLLKRFLPKNNDAVDGILEGMTANSNYVVFSVIISDNDKSYLYVLDKNNMNIKSVNNDYYLKHANDLTYNSKTGYYYVLTANKRLGKFKINSNGVVTDFSFLDISGDYSALAYDKDDDYYISYGIVKEGSNYVKKIFIMDNNFNVIRSFNSPTNLTTQGMGYYNHKIYFVCYEVGHNLSYQNYFSVSEKHSNIIYVYNMDGSLDRTLYFPNTKINGEMESVDILDNGEMIFNYSLGYYGADLSYELYKSDYLKEIDSIKISKVPKKTTYIQNKESLDLSGGMLEIIYNSGKKAILFLSDSDVDVSGFDNSIIGNNIITVKYKNKVTSFAVNIIADSETIEEKEEETTPVEEKPEDKTPIDEKTEEKTQEDPTSIDEKPKEDETFKDDSETIEDKTSQEKITQSDNRDNNTTIYILIAIAIVVVCIPVAIHVFWKK